MRNKIPNANLGYLVDNFDEENVLTSIIQDCINLECFSIGFNIDLINQKLIKNCKEMNLKIVVYSDSNIEYTTALKLWNMEVDSIFIDNPTNYKDVLDNFL